MKKIALILTLFVVSCASAGPALRTAQKAVSKVVIDGKGSVTWNSVAVAIHGEGSFTISAPVGGEAPEEIIKKESSHFAAWEIVIYQNGKTLDFVPVSCERAGELLYRTFSCPSMPEGFKVSQGKVERYSVDL